MTRRQQLIEAQLAAPFDPPTNQRDLVRHYTLSAADKDPNTTELIGSASALCIAFRLPTMPRF